MGGQPITRIRAKNFRSLADVDVHLGPFTVLVGPNGSGKTNLLQVPQFLGMTARFDLDEAITQWGGFDRIQRQAEQTGEVILEIEGQVTDHSSQGATDQYTLTLRQSSAGALSRSETFLFKRKAGQGRRISLGGGKATVTLENVEGGGRVTKKLAGTRTTALATLPRLSDEDGGLGIRAFAGMLQGIRLYEPNVEQARTPALAYEGRLAEDASNLADAMMRLRQEDQDAWSDLLSDMRRCLPGLRDIQFQPVGGAGRSIVVQLIENGLTTPIDLRDASFGTVRLLALLCLLHDPKPPKFVAIEEIDHGLHPYALDILADRLRAASERTQVVVATHSPTFVNRLTPDEMVICERDPSTGASIIPATTTSDIERALAGYDGRAGELWFAGALGGVPA
ncbi:MAG: AAA family ATPase [Phycicoccus sp.]